MSPLTWVCDAALGGYFNKSLLLLGRRLGEAAWQGVCERFWSWNMWLGTFAWGALCLYKTCFFCSICCLFFIILINIVPNTELSFSLYWRIVASIDRFLAAKHSLLCNGFLSLFSTLKLTLCLFEFCLNVDSEMTHSSDIILVFSSRTSSIWSLLLTLLLSAFCKVIGALSSKLIVSFSNL